MSHAFVLVFSEEDEPIENLISKQSDPASFVANAVRFYMNSKNEGVVEKSQPSFNPAELKGELLLELRSYIDKEIKKSLSKLTVVATTEEKPKTEINTDTSSIGKVDLDKMEDTSTIDFSSAAAQFDED